MPPIPAKLNPDHMGDGPDGCLGVLNAFRDFIGQLCRDQIITMKVRDDATKIVDALRFIRVNSDPGGFIDYAVNNPEEGGIYTYERDKIPKVIRDFRDTSMYFHHGIVALKQHVENVEGAILWVLGLPANDRRRNLFVRLMRYDDLVGCLDARVEKAMKAFERWRFPPKVPKFSDVLFDVDIWDELFGTRFMRGSSPSRELQDYMRVVERFKEMDWLDQQVLFNGEEVVITPEFLKNHMVEMGFSSLDEWAERPELRHVFPSANPPVLLVDKRYITPEEVLEAIRRTDVVARMLVDNGGGAAAVASPTESWQFMTAQLRNPDTERPTKRLLCGIERARYWNPSTGNESERDVLAERGQAKPAGWPYTKKWPVSRIPATGRVKLFTDGMGLLWDVNLCYAKEWRYVWSSNACTYGLFWLGGGHSNRFRSVSDEVLRAKLQNSQLRHSEQLMGLARAASLGIVITSHDDALIARAREKQKDLWGALGLWLPVVVIQYNEDPDVLPDNSPILNGLKVLHLLKTGDYAGVHRLLSPLLREHVDLSLVDDETGETALAKAILAEQQELIDALLDRGATHEQIGQLADQKFREGSIKQAVRLGSCVPNFDFNRTVDGQPLVLWALREKEFELCATITRSSGRPVSMADGESIVSFVLKSHDANLMQALFGRLEPFDLTDLHQRGMLLVQSLEHAGYDVACRLLNDYSDIPLDVQLPETGETALHCAWNARQWDLCSALLDLGALIHLQDYRGRHLIDLMEATAAVAGEAVPDDLYVKILQICFERNERNFIPRLLRLPNGVSALTGSGSVSMDRQVSLLCQCVEGGKLDCAGQIVRQWLEVSDDRVVLPTRRELSKALHRCVRIHTRKHVDLLVNLSKIGIDWLCRDDFQCTLVSAMEDVRRREPTAFSASFVAGVKLLEAVKCDQGEEISALLSAGDKPDLLVYGSDGLTVLHHVLHHEKFGILEELLCADAGSHSLSHTPHLVDIVKIACDKNQDALLNHLLLTPEQRLTPDQREEIFAALVDKRNWRLAYGLHTEELCVNLDVEVKVGLAMHCLDTGKCPPRYLIQAESLSRLSAEKRFEVVKSARRSDWKLHALMTPEDFAEVVVIAHKEGQEILFQDLLSQPDQHLILGQRKAVFQAMVHQKVWAWAYPLQTKELCEDLDVQVKAGLIMHGMAIGECPPRYLIQAESLAMLSVEQRFALLEQVHRLGGESALLILSNRSGSGPAIDLGDARFVSIMSYWVENLLYPLVLAAIRMGVKFDRMLPKSDGSVSRLYDLLPVEAFEVVVPVALEHKALDPRGYAAVVHRAVMARRLDWVEKILEQYPPKEYCGGEPFPEFTHSVTGDSLTLLALRHGASKKLVGHLCDAGLTIMHKNRRSKQTAILYAINNGRFVVLSTMYEKTDPRQRGLIILYLMSKCQYDTTKQLLDDSDLEVCLQARSRWDENTPLHFALLANQADLVQLLLTRGSPTDIPNKEGKTAQQLMEECGLQAEGERAVAGPAMGS